MVAFGNKKEQNPFNSGRLAIYPTRQLGVITEGLMVGFIKKIAVVGAGQMGGGIAQTAAVVAKLPVVLFDANSEQLGRQRDLIGRQ